MGRPRKLFHEMKSYSCQQCQAVFQLKAIKRPQKYCSKACASLSMKKEPTRCQDCDSPMPNSRKSTRCRVCWAKSQRTGESYPCANCSTPVYRSPGQIKLSPRTQGVFCGDACMGAYRRTGQKNCPDCGRPLMATVGSNRQTRCRPCWAASRKTGRFYPCRQCENPVYKTAGKLRCAKGGRGPFCDRICSWMYFSGKNAPNYIHGQSRNGYPREFRRIRKKVLLRDGHRCFLCQAEHQLVGPHLTRSNLEVHHIDWDKNNSEMENLVTLCVTCHHKQRAKTVEEVRHKSGILLRMLRERYGFQKPSTTSKWKVTTTTSPQIF